MSKTIKKIDWFLYNVHNRVFEKERKKRFSYSRLDSKLKYPLKEKQVGDWCVWTRIIDAEVWLIQKEITRSKIHFYYLQFFIKITIFNNTHMLYTYAVHMHAPKGKIPILQIGLNANCEYIHEDS